MRAAVRVHQHRQRRVAGRPAGGQQQDRGRRMRGSPVRRASAPAAAPGSAASERDRRTGRAGRHAPGTWSAATSASRRHQHGGPAGRRRARVHAPAADETAAQPSAPTTRSTCVLGRALGAVRRGRGRRRPATAPHLHARAGERRRRRGTARSGRRRPRPSSSRPRRPGGGAGHDVDPRVVGVLAQRPRSHRSATSTASTSARSCAAAEHLHQRGAARGPVHGGEVLEGRRGPRHLGAGRRRGRPATA